MDRILSVFIGGSLVWDFSGACLIARHRCIKKIVGGWTVKTRKKRKKVCSEHKKSPLVERTRGRNVQRTIFIILCSDAEFSNFTESGNGKSIMGYSVPYKWKTSIRIDSGRFAEVKDAPAVSLPLSQTDCQPWRWHRGLFLFPLGYFCCSLVGQTTFRHLNCRLRVP